MNKVISWLENRPKIAWTLIIIYASLIFYLSSLSHPPQPVKVTGGFWLEVLTKTEHAIEYAIFGILLFSGFRSIKETRNKAAYYAFLLASLYGASDEIHQSFVPYRVCDVTDMLTDAAGALAGILLSKTRLKK